MLARPYRFSVPFLLILLTAAACAPSVTSSDEGDGDGDDSNGSGGSGPDRSLLDANGDGVIDSLGVLVVAAFDINGDGVTDGPGVDTNGDGVADAIGIDTDGDGLIDALDTDGDGTPDVVAPPIPNGTGGAAAGGTGGDSSSGGSVSLPGGPWQGAVVAAAEAAAPGEYSAWHTALFDDCGDGTACIKNGGECFSEGVAYGMLATVSADDQASFDKLWAFYKKWSKPNGVMNWKIEACGTQGDTSIWGENGASDAELDAAYALLQASARWGGTYGAEATALITAIKDYETELCSGRIVLKPGDTWGGCSDGSGQERINPSYFSPAYYRAFALHVPDQAAHWTQMVTDTYDLFDLYQARLNNLIPDWSGADGSDWYGAGYGYESVRSPWRIAVDYGLTGDARAKAVLEKLAAYATAQGGPGSVPFDANSAFRGSFALSGITDQTTMDSFYASWIGSPGMDDAPYYQATLRVLFHQVAGGLFYVPTN